MRERTRVGIAGMGFIGRRVYDRIAADSGLGLDVVCVCDRQAAKLAGCPPAIVKSDLAGVRVARPDLVLEAAGAALLAEWGRELLGFADLLPLSVAALADDGLEAALGAAAQASGHRLLIPHGALVGVDALAERHGAWRSVTVTFTKHPSNIELTAVGLDPVDIRERTVVFDGPVREIARRFPRNVNAMVTAALSTVGLDRCRGILVADPGLSEAIAEVRAEGEDGGLVQTVKRGPIVGVSGVEMADAVMHSIVTATGGGAGLRFV
ncbi:aspartate dehydrogenase domain-containing protein [Capillimicrobium parvum]|uniref:L-aspartate dehydrogenase n=1 Tax=Capillimicrobium parvum TaxID=2884022 RepID=A0A9E6XW54_9ACTN|nr:aspartate dehydrogenase domain-containing protein [Capillimicrobium parvum]UGS35275.1 L-aspartate dehydrogenase [Capillimicrobium parvum]